MALSEKQAFRSYAPKAGTAQKAYVNNYFLILIIKTGT